MVDAPTLVLLHGFTNSGASWQPVISGLGQRYRALAPDIRGHASASEADPVTLDAVIGDIANLTDDDFTLVGYSQGGRIALHAALALPGRVSRLVLISASPGLADERERAARKQADDELADRIESMTIEQFAREWAETPVLQGVDPAIAEVAHADRLRNSPSGLASALRGLGTGVLPSAWGRLRELRIPVHMIAGERDAKFVELARQMSLWIPTSTGVTIVPGAGHAVHLERPDAIVEVLLDVPVD
jgi:2-succinyl-6-hydroxy-2,4-cyclohexadiene-1-carboxylate synthase